MQPLEMGDNNTGTRDTTYDLISVLYHALQGAETYQVYADDAAEAGDDEAADFFAALVEDEARRADKAKELLRQRMF